MLSYVVFFFFGGGGGVPGVCSLNANVLEQTACSEMLALTLSLLMSYTG
jgi:hypothetical protein